MAKMRISLKVNGKDISEEIDPGLSLLELLRDHLGLVGTREGCGKGDCGSCTVLLDGRRFVSTGSGKYDMLLLVPKANFSTAGANDYVYLYSHFGEYGGIDAEYYQNDGPEEWRIIAGFEDEGGDAPIPEPITMAGLLLGIGGVAAYVRRRRMA